MIGIAMDLILMLLLAGAVAYGVRLEKKLVALRAGQLAFAGAVTELNTAAGRAETALSALRASGEEADLLHDRLIKARAVKGELEMLLARSERTGTLPPPLGEGGRSAAATGWAGQGEPDTDRDRVAAPSPPGRSATPLPMKGRESADLPDDDDRALRMAALAERIHGMAGGSKAAPAPGRDNVSAILGALTANQAAQQSLNKARRSLDDDLFAA